MASFVLVPGSGGMAWYWHRVVPLMRVAGHEVVAIDLPGEDRRSGLAAYADIVINAIVERSDVILVAQSLAGFTAPLVCTRASVRVRDYVPDRRPRRGKAGRDVCARDGCQPLGDDPHHADDWRQGAQWYARPRACHHQAHQGVSYQNRGFPN
jgi:Alpha/beta hydrolase family